MSNEMIQTVHIYPGSDRVMASSYIVENNSNGHLGYDKVHNVFPIWEYIYKNKYIKFNKDMTSVKMVPSMDGLKSSKRGDIILVPYKDELLLFIIESKVIVNNICEAKVKLMDSISCETYMGNVAYIDSFLLDEKFKTEYNILKYIGMDFS